MADRLSRLDTPALSDALDRLGVEGQVLGIGLLAGGDITGRAFTVRMLPKGLSGKSVGDYIDAVPAGSVVAIDNQGRLDATVWGDLLTTVASRNEVAGTVIDGVCRDLTRAAQLGYPLYARGNTMRTGKDRVSAEAFNEPVQIGGVRVEPGDWIRADRDGVTVLPASLVENVVEVAEDIARAEQTIRERISAGRPLAETRAELNYHNLQTGMDAP